MADDQDTNQAAEEVAEVVEKEVEKIEVAAEKAVEAADEAKEALVEAKETVVEIVEEAVAEKPKKITNTVSKDLGDIISKIEKLSVLELADLVHALEDKFGVSAQAPVAVAGVVAANSEVAAAEEQTTFNVILKDGGANKISAIKAVRELVPTLGLKEAKDLVEGAPKPVLEGVNKETANEAKTKLTAAGATVDLQ